MKNLFMLPCAAIAMALCSCTSNEDTFSGQTTDVPMKVNVSIAGQNAATIQSRAGYETDSKLSQFYLQVENPNAELYSYNAVMKSSDGSTWKAYDTSDQALTMKWENLENSVNVTAATFALPTSGTTVSLATQTDQTTEANVLASDHLLQATASTLPSLDGLNVNLSHAMAKVKLKITMKGELSGKEANPLEANSVIIGGTKVAGTLDVVPTADTENDGAQKLTWTATGDAADITAFTPTNNYDGEKYTATYEAILVPQNVSEGFCVSMKEGDNTYKWTSTSAVNLEAGTEYTLELTAGKHVVTMSRIQVQPWGAGTITGGEMEIQQTGGPGAPYTIRITDDIYQSASNSKLYKVYGSVDQQWHEMVDLGVKVGGETAGNTLLFAKNNIGAESETEKGSYFKWGATEAGDTQNYRTSCSTDLTDAEDAAYVLWGTAFRMPTLKEFKGIANYVLKDEETFTVDYYCYKADNQTSDGIYCGVRVYPKGVNASAEGVDKDASIYLPFTYAEANQQEGWYWTRTRSSDTSAYTYDVSYGKRAIMTDYVDSPKARCFIRAVAEIPSKTK